MSTVFPTGTILTRKTEYPDLEGELLDKSPYNRVRVVGDSPTRSNALEDSWANQPGDVIVVTPADAFGPNVSATIPQLQSEYTIESIPAEADPNFQIGGRAAVPEYALKSAEQAFAEEAGTPEYTKRVARDAKRTDAKKKRELVEREQRAAERRNVVPA